jgi:hypothetical protein
MTALLMLAGVRARSHYLVIAYPLPFVWLAWLLLTHGGPRLYRTALALQLAITVTLLLQIHRDGGVATGAYGPQLPRPVPGDWRGSLRKTEETDSQD